MLYLLHRRAYRESSQLLDIFGEKQGRFSALYRVNKKNPPLQPFISYRMQFSGRGELKYAQHVEVIDYPQGIEGRRLYCGLYLNELMARVTWKGEAHSDLFVLYRETLQSLGRVEHVEPLLRRFEFHLLRLLGYQYDWLMDINGQEIDETLHYGFDPHAGFYRLSHGAEMSIPGQLILAIAHNDWQHNGSWKAAKYIARIALQPLLGDKPLVSRSLFQIK